MPKLRVVGAAALVEAAERLVVLADHTKWGTVGISSIVPLDRADVVITDEGIDRNARAVLAEQVAEVIVAGTAPTPDTDDTHGHEGRQKGKKA